MKILVTGAEGSVGQALCPRLRELGHTVIGTDITRYDNHLDVTDWQGLLYYLKQVQPEVVYHLAGVKQAPDAELSPTRTTLVNVVGTRNVVEAAKQVGARVIFASTCKACDPETVYGATKLIAERIVLNAGGTVVRFYNVREAGGNVFRLWENIPGDEPIPYTPCIRHFCSMDQVLDLCISVLDHEPGRYTLDPGLAIVMRSEAERLYPEREHLPIPARRGDRRREPRHAASEVLIRLTPSLYRIESPHDP